MELYRKAYTQLLNWKNKNNRHPLIIDGLRQVGKSHLAEYFGSTAYKNYIFFDLRFDKNARDIFAIK